MTSLAEFDDATRPGFSLRTLLGVHSIAAGVMELAANAPLIAAVAGTIAALILLQLGVLAACTLHVPRG